VVCPKQIAKTPYAREFGLTNAFVQPKLKVPALPGIILIANFYLSAKLVQARAVFRLSAAE
jgi:hypothetical protein